MILITEILIIFHLFQTIVLLLVHHHICFMLFEYALEYIRRKKYKKYPSRFSCLYAFGDYESCKKVSELKKWPLENVKKYKIKKQTLYSMTV